LNPFLLSANGKGNKVKTAPRVHHLYNRACVTNMKSIILGRKALGREPKDLGKRASKVTAHYMRVRQARGGKEAVLLTIGAIVSETALGRLTQKQSNWKQGRTSEEHPFAEKIHGVGGNPWVHRNSCPKKGGAERCNWKQTLLVP